jgi:hypothetical protein
MYWQGNYYRDLALPFHPETGKLVLFEVGERASRSTPARHWCKFRVTPHGQETVTVDLVPLEMN